VKSGNLQIRVLGTEFNVRSYSPTDVRVTLITGKVAVSDTCGVHSVEMVPGQSAQLSSDGTFAVNHFCIGRKDFSILTMLLWLT
jgi:ferric-dicitrate binding protein FerR (iron transport regulator)